MIKCRMNKIIILLLFLTTISIGNSNDVSNCGPVSKIKHKMLDEPYKATIEDLNNINKKYADLKYFNDNSKKIVDATISSITVKKGRIYQWEK